MVAIIGGVDNGSFCATWGAHILLPKMRAGESARSNENGVPSLADVQQFWNGVLGGSIVNL